MLSSSVGLWFKIQNLVWANHIHSETCAIDDDESVKRKPNTNSKVDALGGQLA